jgi:hypothetical protein
LHLRRGDQRNQDNPRPAAIDDVMVLVAEVGASIPGVHPKVRTIA